MPKVMAGGRSSGGQGGKALMAHGEAPQGWSGGAEAFFEAAEMNKRLALECRASGHHSSMNTHLAQALNSLEAAAAFILAQKRPKDTPAPVRSDMPPVHVMLAWLTGDPDDYRRAVGAQLAAAGTPRTLTDVEDERLRESLVLHTQFAPRCSPARCHPDCPHREHYDQMRDALAPEADPAEHESKLDIQEEPND